MRDLDGGIDRPPRPPDEDTRLLDALRGALAKERMPLHVRDGLRGTYALRELPVLPASAPRLRTAAAPRRRGR
jgi:hypothetical protein